MKFGESLSEGLVPEWKDQYVNYDAGKQKIKKLAALNDIVKSGNPTDSTPLLDANNNKIGADSQYRSVPDGLFKRRQSIFNFSLRSSNNKQEDLQTEEDKFNEWLEDQLSMVNDFYIAKERDIYERFLIIEDQFFQLKEHRGHIVRIPKKAAGSAVAPVDYDSIRQKIRTLLAPLSKHEMPSLPSSKFLRKWRTSLTLDDVSLRSDAGFEDEFDSNFQENQIRNGRIDYEISDDELVNSELHGLRNVPNTQQAVAQDYTPRQKFRVPYLYAKKQLKTALIEHYRLISLIRSYRLMNRTALRKITKKCDKALGKKTSEQFMRKVDELAYFQTSTVLPQILSRIEDLFLTYFDRETQDRKHGLEKLRSTTFAYNNADIRAVTFYEAIFTAGISLGIGLPFIGIALYKGLQRTLDQTLPEGRFLLQIWAGFFLLNLAVLLIGINFAVFARFKINYKFIFEFDLATCLDFRQFFLLPCMMFGALGSFAWLSFLDFWPDKLPGRVWPLLYLALVLVVFLWPGSQFYGSSRRWLQSALGRLLFSGLYPVEFRDFSLGDILCSLTYSLSNLLFFICLYSNDWRHILGGGVSPPASHSKCGSNRSRWMGFLSAMPSIWRFLQCLRRYMDSGDEFPHLANMVKYLIGAVYYCFLSMWRIDRSSNARAAFIVFACINSIYCSAWDIIMDWSLLQPNSANFLLRDNLLFGDANYYYAAVIFDVLFRFQWIFYAFFSNQIQQLAVTSFCIALAELLRRFVWFFFRLENEHSTNVTLFRASRESPLPYPVSAKVERAIKRLVFVKYDAKEHAQFDLGIEAPVGGSSVRTTAYSAAGSSKKHSDRSSQSARYELTRRKSTLNNISDALTRAHIKDFQRKKNYAPQLDESDEDDDDEQPNGITPRQLRQGTE